MTRSARAAAAAAATCANGQPAGSLHAWNAPSEILCRRPESPMTTMRCGRGLGTAKACPPALARRTLGGSGASQVVTGNAEGLALVGALAVGRLAIVAGAARTVM